MKKLIIYFLLLLALPTSLLAQTRTVGPPELLPDYQTLADAFYDINAGLLTGTDIVLQIIGNITESQTAELFESGYGNTSSYTSVTIYPTSSGFTVSGDIAGPLISLNGTTSVTIDGRVGGTTPNTKDLTITNINTGTSAATIQFIESAAGNTVKYCIIKGAETGSASGVIFFTTASSGSGNDGNTIDHNDITSDAAGRPLNVIYSEGSASYDNSGNTISNNNIFDFIMPGTGSNGIYLYSNTTSWSITGNSFYETTSFNPTSSVTYEAIQIINTSGVGFTITGNYIGGSSASCSGTWTKNANAKNNAFYAIYLNVGTSTPSSVQDNTIKSFSWGNSSSATWTGIHIQGGAVNIGTSTGNKIGVTTGTGSITITSQATGANVYGINIASTGTLDCENNIIGSITAANSATFASNITGINKTGTAGTTTISNNTIGSTSTAGSINASSGSTNNAQTIIGINNAGTGTVTIGTNTIANLTNSASSTTTGNRSRINGIVSSNGTNIITGNIIHDLTIANANDASNSGSASVCGIALSGASLKTVSGNTIYNLSNTYSSFVGSVVGLFFIGNTGANVVSTNFIYGLSAASGASSASVYGISMSSGATTYSNNIVSLGGTCKTTIYGIYETGAASNNNSLYFNTVYIGGDGNGGTNKSYALYSAVNTNVRNFRNNIFVNARSTTSGSNLHYAAYIVSTGGSITCDYNDYLASGTYGSKLGYYGADKAVLPIVTGQDISSFAIDPNFATPGGSVAANYIPSASTLVAVTGTGVTTDYDGGPARSTTYPSMGAFEYTVSPTSFTWTGSSSTNWNTTANWNYNIVPSSSTNATIINVTYEPVVNEAPATPAECQNLTISSGAVLTIAAGKALKVDGTLTNSAGNSGLVIKSIANGNDGILVNNTASVAGTVELYLAGGTGGSGPAFHYIVPPVASMTTGATIADVKTNLGLTNFNGDLMAYSESAAGANKDLGWQYFDGYTGGGVYSVNPFSSISSSNGYNIYFTAADKATFTGLLNATASSFGPLSDSNLGWNLVGNPYPCFYDISGISLLTGSGDGVDNTVYFNHDGGYAIWNVDLNTGTSGFSSVMPPMQGFFVHVTSTGKTLSLPTTSKTTVPGALLRSKGYKLVKKIKMVLNNGAVPDETIVCLLDDATSGFDGDYDAYKLFSSGTTTPFIYTELNSIKYALNAIKDPGTSTTAIIPVTIVLKSTGTYKIDVSEFDNLDGYNVYLKHGSDVTILSKGSSYSFTSGPGTLTDFQLVIGTVITGVENVTAEKLKTWYSNNFFYISCPVDMASGKANLIVYDIQGRPVINNNPISLIPGQTIQFPINLPKGVYITHILFNNQTSVSKIVVF